MSAAVLDFPSERAFRAVLRVYAGEHQQAYPVPVADLAAYERSRSHGVPWPHRLSLAACLLIDGLFRDAFQSPAERVAGFDDRHDFGEVAFQ